MVHNCSIKRHCKELMLIILHFSYTKDRWHVDVHILPRTTWHYVEPSDMAGHDIPVQSFHTKIHFIQIKVHLNKLECRGKVISVIQLQL